MDNLAPSLTDIAQGFEFPIGSRDTELFLKFAPRHVDAGFILGELPLGYRPCAIIALRPERTAGMDQEDLQPPVPLSVHNQTGTSGAQPLNHPH